MDPQAQQPTDAQPVEQADAAASDQPQEPASGLMNRFIRGVSGLFGRDDAASEQAEEQAATDAATTEAAEQQPSQAQPQYTQADFDRAVQSRSDQLLARQQRDWAKGRADAGDLQPIRDMARRRDPWALQQLEQNGDTWELGEIKAQELREAQQRENDPLPILASNFDQAVLHPILGALPREDEERIVGQGLTGFDGRQQAVTQAIARIKTHAAAEAIAKSLDDEGYVTKLLGDSAAFRLAILRHPVLSKQLRALFRGDLNEPDLNPGLGPGGGGQRESDVMNSFLRGLASDAERRGPTERAAGAGARNGRAVNLDLLDDE